jgi:hypothetical protein
MSLTITRTKGEVHSKGGGIIKVQEVNESGSDLSPRAQVIDLGYLQDSEFNDATPLTDVPDETGAIINQEEGIRTVYVKCTLMQSGKGILNIPKECRNKFFRLYKYNGQPDGINQEMFFGIGKIKPAANLKFSGGRVPFEYMCSQAPSTITIDSTGLAMFNAFTTGSVVIASGDYYTVV